jgi:hypothetical protein
MSLLIVLTSGRADGIAKLLPGVRFLVTAISTDNRPRTEEDVGYDPSQFKEGEEWAGTVSERNLQKAVRELEKCKVVR